MSSRAEKTPLPTGRAIIEMAGIRKVYDTGKVKVEALKGVDLKIEKGEFVAIVGPSGSGKSTLMNLLGCLDTPSGGDYFIGGEKVAGLTRDALAEVRNRRVGFVFQAFNLLPTLTAKENILLPLDLAGRRADPDVLTEAGAGQSFRAGLLRFCKERMPASLVPKEIHVVTALPKNSSGKVLKREIQLPRTSPSC